ncbi:DUF4912 domain-containing protein [Paenibacillus sp. SI8]|uniref:DUF4912 domain-containing protein n=1 Tax=unclassified Paenibacillus TaxID=185978 RepID=UPI0034674EA4
MLLKVHTNYLSREKVSPIPTQTLHLDQSDRDTLHLLVQSPSTLFVYWHLSSRKCAMIQEHFGSDWQSLKPALRLYDTTGIPFDGSAAGGVSEIPLPKGESCFLSGFRPERAYIADLGIQNEHGQFLPLLRSNRVETPRSDYSIERLAHDANQNQHPEQIPLTFKLLLPESYEHFSAYSVYIPKASADTEPGGDSD